MKYLYPFFFSLLCSSFLFGQTLQPTEKAALLHVVVTDFSEVPIPQENEIIMFRSEKSGKTVKRVTDAEGKFDILLPKGDTYSILYQDFLEDKDYSTIEIPNEPGWGEATMTVKMEEEDNAVYELDIHFETAKATINSQSYNLLDDMVELMKRKKDMKIELAGHTDSDGSAESNLKLSKDRANAVKAYLVKQGIASSRVQTVGYGESKPVESNDTAQGKARNRRTEVRVVK